MFFIFSREEIKIINNERGEEERNRRSELLGSGGSTEAMDIDLDFKS